MELLPPSGRRGDDDEDPYADPGLPRLGLYEHLPDIGGANDGGYEELAPMSPAEIAEYEAEEAAAKQGTGQKPKKVKARKKSVQGEAWVAVRRDQIKLDKQTTSASWFLTGMQREQIRW